MAALLASAGAMRKPAAILDDMNKTFWAIVAVIVVIFGGIILLKHDKTATQTASSAKPTSHIIGKGTAGVTLVEYGDFQCRFCGEYFPTVQAVKEKYGDQIKFQFRNLPLLQVHQHAFAAARAAEAASLQGKFWEMYELLFSNQITWSGTSNPSSIFEQYAEQIGLDVARFKKDASSTAVNDTINADVAEFNKTGNQPSTPMFFLNGKHITPRNSLEEFTTLIDAEIAKHKSS